MCGILGFISDSSVDRSSEMIQSLKAMIHRGPDYQGLKSLSNNRVWLGHTRLSIIDLDPRSHQPFCAEDLGLYLVFNGEIYNHKELRIQLEKEGYQFHTTSDTEVLLKGFHFWGKNVTTMLRGMFAFAIYDKYNEQLYCARDRAGEKPFFYCHNSKSLVFASELKGLFPLPGVSKEIDLLSLDYLLAYGTTPKESSIISGIHKLLPGHELTYRVQSGDLTLNAYWKLPKLTPDKSLGIQELTDKLHYLALSAVNEQLEADVPVGVLLSGGIDSSLVTALAAETGKKIKTFNVSFPGYDAYDESQHAELIANHFGTEHYRLDLRDIEPDLFGELATQFDDPIFDSSMVPTFLVSKLVKEHCTVALGGDGGDELFGGYKQYRNILTRLSKLPASNKFFPIIHFFQRYKPFREHPRWFWFDSLTGSPSSIPFTPKFLSAKNRSKMFHGLEDLAVRAEYLRYLEGRDTNGLGTIDILTRFDLSNYLATDILVKIDKASMLNSLEMRSPFLDSRILDFAFKSVPSEYKTSLSQSKVILQSLSKKILPAQFNTHRKQGFSIPLNMLVGRLDTKFSFLKRTLVDKELLFGLEQLSRWSEKYSIELPFKSN